MSDIALVYGNSVHVFGEFFEIGREEGELVLSHRDWSLSGTGPTITAALESLFAEAREIALLLADEPDSSLSDAALRMRKFSRRVR